MDATAGRSSGIPRLSKLPLPKTKAPLPPPPQQIEQQAVGPLPKSTTGGPKLAKRTSTVNVSRPSQPPAKESAATSRAPTSRSNLSNGTKTTGRSLVGGTTAAASRAKQQSRQISTSSIRNLNVGEDEEGNDRLASLDSFRSASRQGSRLGFRSDPADDSPFEALDDVEPPEQGIAPKTRKTSRLSLSDRTIGSLQNVPSTPKERRRSSFFNPVESPMGPPPQPGTSLSRNESNGSRPGTSDGLQSRTIPSSPPKPGPASAQPTRRTSRLPGLGSSSSSRRSISGNLTSKLQSAKTPASNKTIASRPAKPKPALGAAFASPKKTPTDDNDTEAEPKRVISNSSIALRQQIAAAKAAARKEKAVQHDSPQDLSPSVDMGSFETELHADPFNQAPKDDKHILRNRINAARTDGKLNIAAMGLKEIPAEVRQMYTSSAMEESKVNWAEVVDLTRLIAADNELESLDDGVFPDVSHEDLAADEQSEGNQFGGLELLDLHSNALSVLPMGLRRLERLTKLDLAYNKLDNAAFDVIAEIRTLKELKLGNNNLTGNVPTSICGLPHLQTLDLQANRLLSLPEALRELVGLRVLNVSGNQLTALPMDALQQLPLVELDASGNALIASLFPLGGANGHPTLQVLNVSNNSLAALTFMEPLNLPQLKNMDVTNNHMTILPTVAGWTELHTLLAGDNKISDFPLGFTSLQKLRVVNLASNEIRLLDPEISRMSSLDSLLLASNPLREKKFLTMSAADIKRDLKSRLAPESVDGDDMEEPTSPVTVIGDYERPSSMWTLKENGRLDLTFKGLSDDLNDALGSFLNSEEVKSIQLQNNEITCIPPALWMGQELRVLDLSENNLSVDYLSDELVLPALQELNLSKCRLTSLEPLATQLQAPNLRTLNVSANRLSGDLPVLRKAFPLLTTLFATDNKIASINAESLRGLHTVNLASNDIAQLPAEIGLLWDAGLRSFEVGANAFRVPNYRILQKGTESTLRWLRDKLPVADDAARPEDDLD